MIEMKSPSSKRPRATPEMIVATARSIARERGWNAVTIRAIADALGYASPLIYEHFRSKEDAFDEIARLGFAELEASLADFTAPEGTTDRIVGMGIAYVEFARRSPELYRVMHGMDGVVLNGPALAEGAHRVCLLAERELKAWAEAEGVSLPHLLEATETMWCLLHGIATLTLVGRLTSDQAPQVRRAVQGLLAGWRNPL